MSKKIKYFLSAAAVLAIGTIIVLFFISGFGKDTSPVVNPDEVRAFLREDRVNPELETLNNRIKFFGDKASKDNFGTVTTGMLAGSYSARFGLTGNINDIVISDSLWEIVCKEYNGTKASVYQSLSMNSLSRHEFRKSLDYANNAYLLG